MPLSYNTSPPSASRHMHFAMRMEHHRIYEIALSKTLAFQIFQNHFLRFPMANSYPSLDIKPDRPSHQLKPGTRQHCFNTRAHMSNQLSDRMCPGLSLCPMLTACLIVITVSNIHNLGQDLLGRVPTPSRAPMQSYPTDAEFHASLRPCIPVRHNSRGGTVDLGPRW
jgi:hypothetical protein